MSRSVHASMRFCSKTCWADFRKYIQAFRLRAGFCIRGCYVIPKFGKKYCDDCAGEHSLYVASLKYKIDIKEVARMRSGKFCEICKKESALVIDHCHLTDAVRGAICDRCNKGLGMFDDSVETMISAINYLRSN